LKLPLVLRAIKDQFAQNWVSSEYQKIGSYDIFKEQFSKLFWNELEQSRVRCDVYQGRYNRDSGETMTEHYVKYASLAANLQPPLSEYDLVTALNSHFPIDIQRAVFTANVKISQEVLAFLERMQSLDSSFEKFNRNRHDQNPNNYERNLPRHRDQGGGNSYRATPREVRQVRYGCRENVARSQRERGTADMRSYQTDKRNSPRRRNLNPHIPEFLPRNSGENRRAEQVITPREGTITDATHMGNY
jgi:hypothetical protein